MTSAVDQQMIVAFARRYSLNISIWPCCTQSSAFLPIDLSKYSYVVSERRAACRRIVIEGDVETGKRKLADIGNYGVPDRTKKVVSVVVLRDVVHRILQKSLLCLRISIRRQVVPRVHDLLE